MTERIIINDVDITDHVVTSEELTLTPKEHAAWTLAQKGMSERTIALHLGLSRSAIRARLENARRKLARKDAA